jgi:transposase
MQKHITHVALDDSKRAIVAGILRPGSQEPDLRSIPNEPRHLRRLFERLKREGRVVACYEAGPSGYDLYRQLTALGIVCQVIAPALTPRKPGDRIKTDRRDAAKLVRLFRAGELTAIHVPDEAAEAVRDLLRCREDVQEDLLRWRHRLVKFLARHGRVYRAGRHWTQRHWTWLRSQQFPLPALARTYQEYRWTVEQLLARRAELDQEILALAETAPYRERVGWLRCFRGIDTLSAMGLLTELGAVPRFPHPRELMAYLGLVPSEHSTGGRERRGGITKAGNTHARRILVEAAWHYRHPPRLGGALARRSQGQPKAVVTQAWQAQHRLHRRYRHLVGHGKRPPVAVVACARELVGLEGDVGSKTTWGKVPSALPPTTHLLLP